MEIDELEKLQFFDDSPYTLGLVRVRRYSDPGENALFVVGR